MSNDDPDSSNFPVSRRDLLKYGGTATAVGFAGFTGVIAGSEPAIAEVNGNPSFSPSVVEGTQPINGFDITHQGLSSSDITVTYEILQTGSVTQTKTQNVSTSQNPASASGVNMNIPQGSGVKIRITVDHEDISPQVAESDPNGTGTTISQFASGGNESTFTDSNGVEYRIHAFKNTGENTNAFTINGTRGNMAVDTLIVAGGGGGGNSGRGIGGGGGAGGVISKKGKAVSDTDYTITVGDGGNGSNGTNDKRERNGDDSEAFGLTAIGGGRGSSNTDFFHSGANGGSGGGQDTRTFDSRDSSPGTGLQPSSADGGFGNDGGNGKNSGSFPNGGGGGAGSVGGTPDGGDGKDFSADYGTTFGEEDSNGDGAYFAGGGGGRDGGRNSSGGGEGGLGGGGAGGGDNPGSPNTGGGGGGGSDNNGSGAGGSGIVLVRYQI